MTIRNDLSGQSHWLVKVNGIEGYFETITGGEVSSEATSNFDGGARQPEYVTGPALTGNITVGRKYKRARDGQVLRALRGVVGDYYATVSKQAIDRNGITVGAPTTYPNALLIRITEPDADSNSNDISAIELEFVVGAAV